MSHRVTTSCDDLPGGGSGLSDKGQACMAEVMNVRIGQADLVSCRPRPDLEWRDERFPDLKG